PRELHAAPLRHALEVGPGREHLTRAGEHEGTQHGIGFDLVEEPGHRLADFGTDRIARVGAIEREQRGAAAPLHEHKLFGHVGEPNALGASIAAVTPGRKSRVTKIANSISAADPKVVQRRPMWSASLPCTIAPSG